MKISIITVCKNAVTDIEETIISVINQTYTDIEYIVVDGKSTDGTLEVIQKYKKSINSYISEEDSGIYDAMNKGVKMSSGAYLVFLNAGDVLKDSSVIADIVSEFNSADLLVGAIEYDTGGIKPRSFEKLNKYYLYKNTLPHQGTFIKRDLFFKYGLYDIRFKIGGDYEFFLKMCVKHNCKLKRLQRVISVYSTKGLSNNPNNKTLISEENRLSRERYFTKCQLLFFAIFSVIRIPWVILTRIWRSFIKINQKSSLKIVIDKGLYKGD